MHLRTLWLEDFRSYGHLELQLPEGLTVIVGRNGEGKTNLLEAVGWLATMRSFRGAPTDAMVRDGAPTAIVRADVGAGHRSWLLEAELARSGRNRIQVNRRRLRRSGDLLGHLRVTLFSPEDLALVKGGPAHRRELLDDALVTIRPAMHRVREQFERVLRQRNALLRQAAGRLTPEVEATLQVWNAKLVESGERIGSARAGVVEELAPLVHRAYTDLAPEPDRVEVAYEARWREHGLGSALDGALRDDLRRGITTVGPHRDELGLWIDRQPARTHRSQGEQRSLALALRLAVHRHVEAATGTPPVLLLDDVLSELDPDRAMALVRSLPRAQAVLTSAMGVPRGTVPTQVVEVRHGAARPVDGMGD